MGGADQAVADLILQHQLDLLRLEAGTRARIMRLLTDMQAELTAKLMRGNLTEFGKARLQTLLKQATSTIDDYYVRIAGEMDTTLRGVADITAARTADTLGTVIVSLDAGLPTETFLTRLVSNSLIMGAPSAEWWGKQETDTAFRFANAVRQGVAQGETNEQIAARVAGSPRKGIPGIMDTTRANARSLVHTSIQAVANESRVETFRQNADVIESLVWLATLDGNTCPEICGPRDQLEYTVEDQEPIDHNLDWEGGPGAIHWGCRCAATVKIKPIAGLDLPVGQRASSEGPVSARTNFQSFLDRQDAAWQDEVLGPGRAKLYRAEKLTLNQLLSFEGSPLSLEKLKAKYA